MSPRFSKVSIDMPKYFNNGLSIECRTKAGSGTLAVLLVHCCADISQPLLRHQNQPIRARLRPAVTPRPDRVIGHRAQTRLRLANWANRVN